MGMGSKKRRAVSAPHGHGGHQVEIVDEEEDGDYGREGKNDRHRHHSGQARPRAGQGSGGRVVSERFQSAIFQKGRDSGRARRDEGTGRNHGSGGRGVSSSWSNATKALDLG